MSWYNSSISDLEYSDFMNFGCPYNYECTDCEYDCEVEE